LQYATYSFLGNNERVSRNSLLEELLQIGKTDSRTDLASEKGVTCEGLLPPESDPKLVERAKIAKAKLGSRALILGHHYQRQEVIDFADITGDSFKLAQAAAESSAELIFFCGVHFMAESADILTSEVQKVILPDSAAGCSMADMASLSQVEQAWAGFEKLGIAKDIVPITYMNSSAAIKAFVGRHNGTVCTSSNAARALEWAFAKGEKVFFLPDQHLGRNTAVEKLGISLEENVVYNPWLPAGGLSESELQNSKMILWKGHCSVHARFSLNNIVEYRSKYPDIKILVHPECKYEVVSAANQVGSTEQIISTIANSPVGSRWAIGTEFNLVTRIARDFPDRSIHYLEEKLCFCSTMNRIDLPHLVWALESAVNGRIVNQIKVKADDAAYAQKALNQMLALP
jgi:quinolinate synthase